MRWQPKHTFVCILFLVVLSCLIIFDTQIPFLGELYKPIKKGLDLEGGSHLLFQLKPTKEMIKKKQKIDRITVSQVMEIIRERVDGLGVAEPEIRMVGRDRIMVELPGIKDINRAIRVIGKTALLEFKDEEGKVILTGADLKDAAFGIDQFGRPKVDISFNREGAKRFAAFTTSNIGRPLGIYLDGKQLSNPIVQEPILDGSGEITGDFTNEEATDLANLIKAGALPVPLERIEERTVGPTLGKIAIEKGIQAGIIGIAGVLLFMLLYYRIPGLISCIALIFYTLFIFAIFKAIPVTLTLPGIAGLILSIGIAIDANIIIIERLKEELRTDKTIRVAIDTAFSRAFTAIFDANVTTLIICAILYWLGRGPIKGFAVTLSIGILVSMFTALVCSKTMLHLIVNIPWINKPFLFGVSLNPPWFIRRNINLMKMRLIWFTLSLVFILPSLAFLFPPKSLIGLTFETGLKKGIDFSGGSIIELGFKKETTVETEKKVREELKKFNLHQARIQTYGERGILIKTKHLSPKEKENIEKPLTKIGSKVERFETVGPTVGKELTRGAIISVIIALFLICIYLTIRFFQFRYGAFATVALFHDLAITAGIFAILCKFANYEIDSYFVTAILVIIGYSINDTIVIFDRIRENLKLKKEVMGYEAIINFSLLQVFTRSLNTSFTTLIVLFALYFFGGIVLQPFILVLIIGIICGTYSSLFTAAPLLCALEGTIRKRATTKKIIPKERAPERVLFKQVTTASEPTDKKGITSSFSPSLSPTSIDKKKKKKKKKQRRR